jgi:hypothetical protein
MYMPPVNLQQVDGIKVKAAAAVFSGVDHYPDSCIAKQGNVPQWFPAKWQGLQYSHHSMGPQGPQGPQMEGMEGMEYTAQPKP